MPALEDLVETATGIPAAGVYDGRRAGLVPHLGSEVLIRRGEAVSISESGHEDLWVHPIEFEVRVTDSPGPNAEGAEQQLTTGDVLRAIATALDGSRALSDLFPSIVSVSSGELVADDSDDEKGEHVAVLGSEWLVNGSTFAGAPSAAQSTVEVSDTTAAPDGVESVTVTVTVLDAAGDPVPGIPVVLSSTGTGNTITQPTALTNASGVATGSIVSTVPEAKTISATANGSAITDTAALTFLQDPQSILGSKLKAWLDASYLSASTIHDDVQSGFLSSWDNKVPGGTPSSIDQVDSWTNTPAIRGSGSGINGLGGLDFSDLGTNWVGPVAASLSAAPFRLFAVVSFDSFLSAETVLQLRSGEGDVDRFELKRTGPSAIRWLAKQGATEGIAQETGTDLSGSTYLVSVLEQGSSRSLELNGVAGDTPDATTVAPAGVDETYLGAWHNGSSPVHGAHGHLLEWCLVDISAGDITAQQMSDLETYFERWGITIP